MDFFVKFQTRLKLHGLKVGILSILEVFFLHHFLSLILILFLCLLNLFLL